MAHQAQLSQIIKIHLNCQSTAVQGVLLAPQPLVGTKRVVVVSTRPSKTQLTYSIDMQSICNQGSEREY